MFQAAEFWVALATIIFDEEEPLDTPLIFNTLDAAAPGGWAGVHFGMTGKMREC